jgi:raffinose/stachyose/melibiose transport system permease protein
VGRSCADPRRGKRDPGVSSLAQVSRTSRRSPARTHAPGEPRRQGLLYLVPAAFLFAAFVILPLADGIWLSFFSWDGVTPAKWTGIGNYTALLHDPTVEHAFAHALVLVFFYAVLPLAIGLFVASSLSRVTVRASGVILAILFLPQVVAPVVVGVSWRWIFDENGPVNVLLRAVGLGAFARAWLGDFGWALPSVGVIGTWVMLGLCMVLFIGGIQKIPPSLYDAARTDGAGAFREFLLVTVPGLRNEIAIAATLTVITALRAFDLIFVTTHGGPGDATLTPSFLIYTRAFLTGEVGLAAAVATVLTGVVFIVALVVSRFLEGRDR